MTGWHETAGGLYVPFEPASRPLAIDLFSGAGGMSLGLIQAGFDVVAAMEWDPAAIQTYLCNLGAYPCRMIFSDEEAERRMEVYLGKELRKIMKSKAKPWSLEGLCESGAIMSGSNRRQVCPPDYQGVRFMFVGDARKFKGAEMLELIGLGPGDLALVCGGPPCHGFSFANVRRSAKDPRNDLTLEFARLALELEPKTIMMENVPGILSMTTAEGIPMVDALVKIISDGGFGEYDALRKSLLATAGLGLAVKHSGKRKGQKRKTECRGATRPTGPRSPKG